MNKVGTFQIALTAHYHKVPFYVVRNPSAANPTMATVEIEERDPEESLHAMGIRTAPEGVFSPYDLRNTFGPVDEGRRG